METVLTIKNLDKSFGGVKATNDLSLAFEQGKITSLIGPNGAGKSTLVNLLSGYLSADSGELIFGNEAALTKWRAWEMPNHGLIRTFQNVAVFEQMTVLDNLLVVLGKRKWYQALFETDLSLAQGKALSILEQLGLKNKKDDLAINLSYGQRKLLEIGRTLMMLETDLLKGKQPIFLYDEPFAGLFPEMVKLVVSVFKKLRKEGHTILLIEHNMDLIRELSDYVYVLDAGALLAKGSVKQTLNDSKVLDAYLGQ